MTLDLRRQLLWGDALSVWLHSHGFYLIFCLLRIRFWRNEFQFYVQGPGWSWRYLSARNNVPKCVLTGSCWYFCAGRPIPEGHKIFRAHMCSKASSHVGHSAHSNMPTLCATFPLEETCCLQQIQREPQLGD